MRGKLFENIKAIFIKNKCVIKCFDLLLFSLINFLLVFNNCNFIQIVISILAFCSYILMMKLDLSSLKKLYKSTDKYTGLIVFFYSLITLFLSYSVIKLEDANSFIIGFSTLYLIWKLIRLIGYILFNNMCAMGLLCMYLFLLVFNLYRNSDYHFCDLFVDIIMTVLLVLYFNADKDKEGYSFNLDDFIDIILLSSCYISLYIYRSRSKFVLGILKKLNILNAVEIEFFGFDFTEIYFLFFMTIIITLLSIILIKIKYSLCSRSK